MFGNIHPGSINRKENYKNRYIDNKKKTVIVSFLIFILCSFLYLSSGSGEITPSLTIRKNDPELSASLYSYEVKVGEENIGAIEITIPSRKYTSAECEEMSKGVRGESINKLLGENEDLTKITEDLCFFTEISGYPFNFECECDEPAKINSEGEILTEEEFETFVTITFTYEDFAQSFRVKVHVIPGPSVKARVYRNEILAKLETSQDVTEETVNLPREINGEKISYSIPARKRNPAYLGLGIIGIGAVVFFSSKENVKKEKERKEKIMDEYPVLLEKMALYLQAGMTIRGTFIKIYEEGCKKKDLKNPLYEEMGTAVNELTVGISEALVYKHFGERTGVSEMIRFTALLSQNLKKGSTKLKDLLIEESNKAQNLKRSRAIQKGEKAGTKLLMPMMLLLVEVLVMIMVPAFLTI